MRIFSTAAALLFLLAPASVALAQNAPSQTPGTKSEDVMPQKQAQQTQPKHKMHHKSARHKKYGHHRAAMYHKAKPHKTSLYSKGTAHKAGRRAKATAKPGKAATTY